MTDPAVHASEPEWCPGYSDECHAPELHTEIRRLRAALFEVMRSAREHGLHTCADFAAKALAPRGKWPA